MLLRNSGRKTVTHFSWNCSEAFLRRIVMRRWQGWLFLTVDAKPTGYFNVWASGGPVGGGLRPGQCDETRLLDALHRHPAQLADRRGHLGRHRLSLS
ncbi:hypothetical protein CYK37_15895 [Mesorhizobium loti]|nr:hypothetical protein CYK37_15895 [Mesorhizobium loti]